jgi:hypothetical protein
LRERLISTLGLSAYDFCQIEMSNTDPISTTAIGTKLLRVLVFINFVLLVALIGPGNSRQLYLAERRTGLAHIIVHSLQVWFVGSTVIVTVLFIRMLVFRSKALRSQNPTKLDWTLFLGWWFVVVACCVFAFMVGMGG